MKNLLHKFKEHLRPVEQPIIENAVCKNCDTVFTGRFCPGCGQSVSDFDKPFGFIIVNFLGDFFAFDTRFFRTLKNLILRPGFLATRFFEGKRAPYAPPIRIFIFLSFLMFLLLQWQTSRIFNESALTVNDIKYAEQDSASKMAEATEKIAQADTVSNDSIIRVNLDPVIFGGAKSLKEQLAQTVKTLEKNLETAENEEDKKEIRQLISTLSNPQMMVNQVLKMMSWAFFLLLPVFALILKLFYFRVHYVRHLIFSIYIHSFIFIVIIAIVLLGIILNNNASWPVSMVLLTVPIYLIVAMKNFYGQKVLSVLPRFAGVTFLYNFIFFVVLFLVVLKTMLVI